MIFCSIPERGVDTEYLSACYLESWGGACMPGYEPVVQNYIVAVHAAIRRAIKTK